MEPTNTVMKGVESLDEIKNAAQLAKQFRCVIEVEMIDPTGHAQGRVVYFNENCFEVAGVRIRYEKVTAYRILRPE